MVVSLVHTKTTLNHTGVKRQKYATVFTSVATSNTVKLKQSIKVLCTVSLSMSNMAFKYIYN